MRARQTMSDPIDDRYVRPYLCVRVIGNTSLRRNYRILRGIHVGTRGIWQMNYICNWEKSFLAQRFVLELYFIKHILIVLYSNKVRGILYI